MRRGQTIRWVVTVLSILCFLGLGIPSIGVGEEEGFFSKFHPYITVDEEYTTNVDLTNNKLKRDDFITTISPGFRFSTSEKTYGLDLDVNAGFNFYAHEEERNYVSVYGSMNGWYALTPRLTFRAREYILRSEEPREPNYSATAIQGEFLLSTAPATKPYIRNVFEPSLEYQFGRESVVSLYYRNNVYRNESEFSEDSLENFISPKLIYWFDIRNGITLQYGFLLGNFEKSPDLVGHTVNGRYTYRFNPKTSIFVDYTFATRHFESRPGSFQSDYDVHNPSVGIEHNFSPTLKGMAQIGYFWQLPQIGSTTDGPSFNLSLTHAVAARISYTLLAQGGYTEDYFTSQNLGFSKYYRGIATINYQLLQKLTVGLSGSIERALRKSEKEWISGIWSTASYQLFKWLTLSLEGSHRENHSTIDFNNYSEYRGIFRVTAAY